MAIGALAAGRLVSRKRGRLALLGGAAAGWVGFLAGIVADVTALVVAFGVLAGLCNLAMLKLVLEWRTAMSDGLARQDTALSELAAGLESTRLEVEEKFGGAAGDLEKLAAALRAAQDASYRKLDGSVRVLERKAAALRAAQEESHRKLGVSVRAATKRVAAVESLRTELDRADGRAEVLHAALAETRGLVERVAAHLSAVTRERLAAVAEPRSKPPLLSIAVPSFNRPEQLAECLASVGRAIAAVQPGDVELFVLDDASTDPDALDVAVSFAERHEHTTVRQQPQNRGLERNMLDVVAGCRGDYVLVLGNDDALIGDLDVVLDDLRRVAAGVHVYEKTRVTADGKPFHEIVGSKPVDLPLGDAAEFPTYVAAGARQGIVSTFGYTGQIVFRRDPFVAVDATPFLDLTMFPQVFLMLEAFGSERVLYRNLPIVRQRSLTQIEQLAEAIGRREEHYRTGGSSRRNRYFGTTLAAACQRAIDRGSIDAATMAAMPEMMLTRRNTPVINWIAENRTLDPGFDAGLDPHVVADANRFGQRLDADQL